MILEDAVGKHSALRIASPPEDIYHCYYRYYCFVKPERLKEGWDRDRIMKSIAAEGVPCFSGSCSEIYLEKAFTNAQIAPAERLPVALELGETSLAFLVHPTLSEIDIKDVATAIDKVMEEASV